ncbi:MAG: DNA translocase FtsK 4TM domain-containing protein, partial [Desulfobaccales bacterium]
MATKSETPKKKVNARKPKAAPRTAPEPAPEVTWQRRLGQEMAALLLLGLAGFFLLALGSHAPADPQGLVAVWRAAAVANAAGKAGALMAAYCLWGLGLAAFWLPLMFLGLAWQSHRQGLEDLGWPQTVAAFGVLLASAALLAQGWDAVAWGGGWLYAGGSLGRLIAGALRGLLNPAGASLALGLVLLLSIMGATRLSYVGLMAALGEGLRGLWGQVWPRREEEEFPEAPPYEPRRLTPARPIITKNGQTEEPVLTTPPPEVTTAPAEAAAPKTRKAAAS